MSQLKSKPLLSSRSFWRVVRAALAANENLSAEEAASTLFRFFRSNHVIDLKLIAGLALLVFAIHFSIILLLAESEPLTHTWQHLRVHFVSAIVIFAFYAALLAWAFLAAEKKPLVRSDRSSIAGLTLFAIVSYPLVVAVVGEINAFPHLPHKLATYFAPAVPIYAAVIAWAYLTAATRLGVVDLFACEMRTVCRVGTAFDIGVVYVNLYRHSMKRVKDGNGDAPLKEHSPSSTSKDFASEENYFPVFEGNAHDLEALEATVVGNITEFYTYMKVVRDLLRKVENESVKSAAGIYANLIFVVFLGYESARKAIKELIEFEPIRVENMMMILLTELVCYRFLCKHYRNDKLRLRRLMLRIDDYDEDLEYIRKKLKPHHSGDKVWDPAKRSEEELRNRYRQMQRVKRALDKIENKRAAAEKPKALPRNNKETEATLAGASA
jgi:hypothetical protein